MIYRKEIDGLRSVAVLPVVLFHAGISAFSGGFIGVDIFFVISGYLITGIILPELEKGEFSLLKFYERRARRILPALSAVVLACIPVAWLYMLPDPLENFGQSMLATMLSLNNVLLTMTSGYWDLASEFKPLIHTWSLAVEEQFYVVFPLLLMLLYPLLKYRAIGAVWVIVIASFAASIFLVRDYPTSTFYLLHTRAWELGVGALG
ncbi:MAG: acyltransferase, partial [Pseudomonadota bacterium]